MKKITIVMVTKYDGNIPLYEGNAGVLTKLMDEAIQFNNTKEADSYCLNVHGNTEYIAEDYLPTVML